MNRLGPLQLVVIGIPSWTVLPAIASHFEHRDDSREIRLIDALTVMKDGEGGITVNDVSDEFLDDAAMPGSLASSLFGTDISGTPHAPIRSWSGFLQRESADFGLSQDQILEIADLIPRSSMALFLLIEHCWILNVRQTVVQEGGSILANGLITPATLIDLRRQNTKPLN